MIFSLTPNFVGCSTNVRWWIIHTQPTEPAGRLGCPQIPPTQLVDCSYSTYRNSWQARLPPNPTNAVGGLFILNLQKQLAGSASPKSHQRSWWIVHTQPTETAGRLRFPQIPPTQLAASSYSTSVDQHRHATLTTNALKC